MIWPMCGHCPMEKLVLKVKVKEDGRMTLMEWMASTEALSNNCNFTNFSKTLLSILFVKYIAPRTLLVCWALCSLPMQVCPVSWVVCLLRVSCLFLNLLMPLVLASSTFVNQGAWPDHLLVPLFIILPWFLSSLNLNQLEAREKWTHLRHI